MNDYLDLDALLPESRKIKLKGVEYECLPVTIEQLIKLAKLMNRLKTVKNDDEIKPLILKTLQPIVPELKDVNLTVGQLLKLVEFAQEVQAVKETTLAKEHDIKKNPNSVEELPNSSDSTPATQ